MGDPVGAVQCPVERDGPARRVSPGGLLGDRTAARSPDRRPSERRDDAAVARRPARGRPAVGGPPPARLLRAATPRPRADLRRRPSLRAAPRPSDNSLAPPAPPQLRAYARRSAGHLRGTQARDDVTSGITERRRLRHIAATNRSTLKNGTGRSSDRVALG